MPKVKNNEWSFLIKLCSVFISRGSLTTSDTSCKSINGLNWEEFYELSAHHRVLSIVKNELSKSGDFSIPEKIDNKMSVYFAARTRFNLTLTRELLILLKILRKNQIEVIPYKGVLLSHFVYGNLGTRPSADIDIMVQFEKLDMISEYLHRYGYNSPEQYAERIFTSLRKINCEISISKTIENNSISIDTHWKIANRMLQMDVGFEEMRRESRVVDFFGMEVNFLNPEALIIVTAMHHFGKEKMVHLKQIIDLAIIARKYEDEIDVSKLERLAKEWRVYKLTMTALLMVKELFDFSYSSSLDYAVRKHGDLAFVEKHLSDLQYSKGKYADNIKDDFYRGLSLHLKIRDGILTKLKILYYHINTIVEPNAQDFKDPYNVTRFQWYFTYLKKPFRLIRDYVIS